MILDVNVPLISGLKALDVIKTSPDWSAVPVYLLTSSNRDDDRAQAKALGADAYHVKPTEWTALIAFVANLKADLDSRMALKARARTEPQ